ncbi:Aste57867_14209 [Aphanomyces stellatus]|uniref:Aste57867_14209 protein n=1 Tax=Aphanomyces stellatus TaxID=120398 RepID=A0A485L022_9STRA|nr:hypothetical protein As57867_014158 [Aphanomyces stellatus]VFT91034.1 Aste57867_14209 [Aphanomyces stellatus]
MKVQASSAAATIAILACLGRVDADVKTLNRFTFGSNNDQDLDQSIWTTIESRHPDLHVSLGNNIVGDEPVFEWRSITKGVHRNTPISMLREKYEKQMNHSEYKSFRASTPVIGIWDDRDYGRKDGASDYPFKADSQDLFLDFIGEPDDSPRRDQDGIYTSHTYGSGAKSVKFILLDHRFHKEPFDPNDKAMEWRFGNILGDAQWKWLENELKTSTATFNFIGTSVPVLPTDRWFGTEGWALFPDARLRLLDLIQLSNASGVVLLSGNVEFADINEVSCGDHDYRLVEATSSGLTHAYTQDITTPFQFASAIGYHLANRLLPWFYRPNPEVHWGGINFGEVAIDWTASPPTAAVTIRDRTSRARIQHAVSATRFPVGGEHIGCAPVHEILIHQYMGGMLALIFVSIAFFISVAINAYIVFIFPVQLLVGYLKRLVFGAPKPKTD